MSSIGVNPPKTPVTEGSGDKSPATLPNVCKMPGPPAPFVPTPLPNIGQSSDKFSNCTSTVKFEGKKVAIKGSYYMSKLSGDIASKGTGGGIISATTEGKTKFVAPGSMNVKAEGKNIQLLGDAMSNNGSNPTNTATVPGNLQPAVAAALGLDADEKAVADELCAAFCDKLKKGHKKGLRGGWSKKKSYSRRHQWSNQLEKDLLATPPTSCAKLGVVFRGVFAGGKTKPDAVLKDAAGKVKRCFDFKFPKDRWRNAQRKRQMKLSGNKKPVTINAKNCGC